MNVLDENFPDDQRPWLRSKRIRFRKIGRDIGRKAMDDEDIIPLLHQLDRPTFFTLDADFYQRRLCHAGYCLVQLDVEEEDAAVYVRRLLRHRALNSKVKRMGSVIRVRPESLTLWRLGLPKEIHLEWV